jgi:hypothetical protein
MEVGVAFAHGAHLEEWTSPFLLEQTFAPSFQVQVGSNGYTLIPGDPSARYLDNIYVGPKLDQVRKRPFCARPPKGGRSR